MWGHKQEESPHQEPDHAGPLLQDSSLQNPEKEVFVASICEHLLTAVRAHGDNSSPSFSIRANEASHRSLLFGSHYFTGGSAAAERWPAWSLVPRPATCGARVQTSQRGGACQCLFVKRKELFATVRYFSPQGSLCIALPLPGQHPVPCPPWRISACRASIPFPGHCSGWCSSSRTFRRTETCNPVL